jgi:hypothetical protein
MVLDCDKVIDWLSLLASCAVPTKGTPQESPYLCLMEEDEVLQQYQFFLNPLLHAT